jgi:hypothetical protein
MSKLFVLLSVLIHLSACGSYNPMQEYTMKEPASVSGNSAASGDFSKVQVEQGQYLVELLNCGSCHTDGALTGSPTAERFFGGSRIGIAYSNPMLEAHPGVVFPANITPDVDTGIGNWQDDDILRFLKTGVDNHGRGRLSVMPWPGYAKLKNEDAIAILAFLRGLTPVHHKVPENVRPGEKTSENFVHFGVYQSKRQRQ